MPYNDPEKEKEASKIRMRRYRERRKQKRGIIPDSEQPSTKQYTVCCGEREITYNIIDVTPERAAELNQQLIEVVNALVAAHGEEKAGKIIFKEFQQAARKVKSFFNKTIGLIPNLLYLHLDLKMLKQHGGTA